MQAITRIFGSPAILGIPALARGKHPFGFGRESICIYFSVERKALQIRAMPPRIKAGRGVSIGGIETFGLAAGVGKKYRIVESNVGRRNVTVFAGQFETCRSFHQRVKFTTSHFMTTHRIVIREFCNGNRTVDRAGTFIRAQNYRCASSPYTEHAFESIRGYFDRCGICRVVGHFRIRTRTHDATQESARQGKRTPYTKNGLNVRHGSHIPKIDFLKA